MKDSKRSIAARERFFRMRAAGIPHPALGKKRGPMSEEMKRKISEAKKAANPRRYPPSDSPIKRLVRAAKSRPCMDCGQTFPTYVMDFDHVRGEKLFNVSQGYQQKRTLAEVAAEIEKCDVVCSNCHRIRTFGSKETM